MKQKKKHMNSAAKKEAFAGYLFIAPFMAGLFVFYIYSFIQNFLTSFTNRKSFGSYDFVGLTNYIKLFQNKEFYVNLGHTFLYVLVCVPAVIVISILVAVALNQKIRGISIYRTLIYLPMVTLPTAISLVWKWLFNSKYGLINGVLSYFGIEGPAWLADPRFSFWAICIVLIWSSIAQSVIIFLAGLQGIPKVYYEASQIDGASKWDQFRKITLPLLSPTTFMMVMMEIIGFFQVFDMIYLMIPATSSGLSGAESVVMMFYKQAFENYKKGYGAAISIVIFIIILIITLIQMRLQKRWVYDGEV